MTVLSNRKEVAFIISLNFNPGHVSHMMASYKQCEELGYISYYYVVKEFMNFLPKGPRTLVYGQDTIKSCDLAIFLFPARANLKLIWQLKHRNDSKIVYIFHEPLAPMRVYREAGFSYKYLAKLWLINHISALTVKWSDVILLPSKKAVKFYEQNKRYKNKNYHYLPLLFDDENIEEYAKIERKYFSYIGTVAADHSFNEFLQFVEKAVSDGDMPNIKFLIATKSEFEVPKALKESPRVVIRKGKPLSNDEINEAYVSTFVVWNAYARTTQSGVLAKSFMFGTPAVVLKENLNEFMEDGKTVKAIEDNKSFEEIEKAVSAITSSFESFSSAARKRFEDTFYYLKYNEKMKNILLSL